MNLWSSDLFTPTSLHNYMWQCAFNIPECGTYRSLQVSLALAGPYQTSQFHSGPEA